MAFSFNGSKPARLDLNFLNEFKENLGGFAPSGKTQGTLESMEIEEEEKHLKILRLQRNKLESLQQDMKAREMRIKELEDMVAELQQGLQDSTTFRNDLQSMIDELREREEDNASLRKQLKKQVEEYEHSLYEIQNFKSHEIEEKSQEIKYLKQKLVEKEKAFDGLSQENLKLKKDLKKVTEAVEIEKDSKMYLADEQAKSWKVTEKMLKDQIMELTHEKILLTEKISELRDKPEKQSIKPQDAKLKLQQKEQEIKLLKKTQEDHQKRTELEINSLKSELHRAVSIITRQESTIVDLRRIKSEDDSLICNLQTQLNLREYDVNRSISIFENITKDSTDPSDSESDQASRLKQENDSLKSRIVELRQKEEKLKQERKKVAKIKMEMLSQRNAEVIKLSDALTAAITRKN